MQVVPLKDREVDGLMDKAEEVKLLTDLGVTNVFHVRNEGKDTLVLQTVNTDRHCAVLFS